MRDVFGLPVPRVTYKNHGYEQQARLFYIPYMLQLLANTGARAFLAPCGPLLGDPPSSAHLMGTLRMGTNARTSVVDPQGRFWDVDNLYAADGAVFPTASGYNPTLTICAVALRTAHGIAGASPRADSSGAEAACRSPLGGKRDILSVPRPRLDRVPPLG